MTVFKSCGGGGMDGSFFLSLLKRFSGLSLLIIPFFLSSLTPGRLLEVSKTSSSDEAVAFPVVLSLPLSSLLITGGGGGGVSIFKSGSFVLGLELRASS